MHRTCFGPLLAVAAPALVPPGKLLAQLGFGATSPARFESNAIIIGGSQGSDRIIAVETPAGR